MLGRCCAELECDLAEEYGFLGELHELPVRKAAVLACGLRSGSRTIRALENKYFGIDDSHILLLDRLGEIAYFAARSAGFKAQKPDAIDITIRKNEKQSVGFDSPEEFTAAYNRIRGGGVNG